MNNVNSISFWIPIVPDKSSPPFTKEWIRDQADSLLSSGDKIYRLRAHDQLTLEDATAPSYWDTALKIAMLATLVLPVIAFIIKIIDRGTHQYTLVVPSPRHSPILNPRLGDEEAPPADLAELPVDVDEDPSLEVVMGKESPVIEHLSSEFKPDDDHENVLPNTQEETLLKEEEEERKFQAAEEKRIQEEKEKKIKEENEQKQIEFYRKCHKVAERVFPKMVDMFYDSKGELNNEYARNCAYNTYWGMQRDEYPERLREMADELEAEGKLDEAEKCRKKAEENERKRENYLKNKFQQTFFPVTFQDHTTTITRQECFVDCSEDFSNEELFHGTTKARAELIKKEGFDPEWPAGHRHLDTGYGVYLALTEAAAQGYSSKDADREGATLRIRVQLKGKFAQYDLKMYHVVNECFTGMANLFVRRNEAIILEELEKEGIHQPGDSTYSSLHNVTYPLVNLFTRDFYVRQGYRGVFAHASHRAQCAYLNLFYPKEDIVSIT